MFKLNKMTDYAVVCLGTLARKPGYSMSATELSNETGLTIYTVQKLLKLLVVKSNLVSAKRGSQGGYALNKQSNEISIVEIIEALDGPISLTACVDSSGSRCETSNVCLLGGNWNRVNEIIRDSLNDISLNDLLSFGSVIPNQDKNKVVFSAVN